MKKSVLAVAFAAALLSTVPAHANDRDADHRFYRGYWNHQKDQSSVPSSLSDPTSVSEPSSLLMLGSGLIALAGIGLRRRREAV